MNSLKKALSYSLRPHELGYCGPHDTDVSPAAAKAMAGRQKKIRDYLSGEPISEEEIRIFLDEFRGAVAYYKLIARKNNIADYYDERVVEAYWLGNELLDTITVSDIATMARVEFVGPGFLTKDVMEEKISKFPSGQSSLRAAPKIGSAHHTFHLFFIGATTGRVVLTEDRIDKCRPGWGEVKEIVPAENKVICKITRLFPMEVETETEIIWDKLFVPELKVGDMVSHHWGRVSEKITDKQLANLKKYTMINFRALMNK